MADSKKSPRTKHKFSFSDQTKPKEFWVAPTVAPSSAGVSNDDILNSMTKQVHPEQASEQFPEVGYATPISSNVQESISTANPHSPRTRNRGSAKGVFMIFLGGFLAVWLYGYYTKAYEIPYLSNLTQSAEVQLGTQLASAHPILLGAATASILFLILGVVALRRRKRN